MRTCSKCNFIGSDDMFTRQGKYIRNTCRQCTSMRVKQWQKNNELKLKSYVKSRRWTRHGLTEHQFNTMMMLHDGNCHACFKNPAVHIDHDHSHCPGMFGCNKCVRGILCYNCNLALGLVNDDPTHLIKYLGLLVQ